MKHSTLSNNFQLYISTVGCRAYNIELHTLNYKSDYSGMSAALNIWVMRLKFINRVDNPKFSFNNPVVLCNMALNYIATFVCVRLYPAILNVKFSEIETKSAKNYGMSVGDMTSAKSLSQFISTCFCSSIRNLINIDRPRLMEANNRQLNNFEQNIAKFKRNLIDRGYPEMLNQKTLSEVKLENRNATLTPKPKENKRILLFVTQYQLSVPNLKHEKLVFNRTTTVKRNFQGTSYNTLYKGAFTERYTR